MVSSRIEKRRSVSHRSALALNTQATSDGRTGVEHRPQGELGGPRSQPYNVWHQGKIVYFCLCCHETQPFVSQHPRSLFCHWLFPLALGRTGLADTMLMVARIGAFTTTIMPFS